MRSLNFRDNVLWAICYKLGLDPVKELLTDQARALSSYINAWVRRLWPATDWPEWTIIAAFVPTNHIVPYSSLGATDLADIGRVYKVYLVDPRTTPGDALDTPHRLMSNGIHVGFEHGPSVWIKYQAPPPQYTTDAWDSGRSYFKDELTYSPRTGEVYKSKANSNRGNDPAGAITQAVEARRTQEWEPDNPGIAVQPKILQVSLTEAGPPPPAPDPAPDGTVFKIYVTDVNGDLLGEAFYTTTGDTPLSSVLDELKSQLEGALSGYVITTDNTAKWIRIQDTSDFYVWYTAYTLADEPAVDHVFKVSQVQAYTPELSSDAETTPAIFEVTLPSSQVIPGALYSLKVTDLEGTEHTAEYTALESDGPAQVLAGIIAAVQAAGATDAVLEQLSGQLDVTTPNATFRIGSPISLELLVTPPGSPYWTLVPFPEALVDQVVRGAYADALKEGGQNEKAQGEEQAVPLETQVRAGAFSSQQYQPLSDQEGPTSRFSVK